MGITFEKESSLGGKIQRENPTHRDFPQQRAIIANGANLRKEGMHQREL